MAACRDSNLGVTAPYTPGTLFRPDADEADLALAAVELHENRQWACSLVDRAGGACRDGLLPDLSDKARRALRDLGCSLRTAGSEADLALRACRECGQAWEALRVEECADLCCSGCGPPDWA